ncbi:MAG: glycosyltransferase, partial [Candidatus Hodarchaeota archaeon]
MRILQVVNVLPDSENPLAQVFVKTQIDSIRKMGVEVSVYNVRGNVCRWNYLKAIGAVRELVRREHFDIVHGHYVYSGWIAAFQRRFPSVVSFMGSDLNGSPKVDGTLELRGYLDICLSKLLQFFVNGIIVKTRRMKKKLSKKKKCLVLPNGVDFNMFKEIARDEARRKLRLDLEKKYVLFAGNYKEPAKAFPVIVKAVQILKEEDTQVELLLAY